MTVAKHIEVKDKFENMGANLVRQVSNTYAYFSSHIRVNMQKISVRTCSEEKPNLSFTQHKP